MKNTKKLISILLAVFMITGLMAVMSITSSAMECSWDLYDGDQKLIVGTDSSKSIYWDGGVLVLKNYSGKALFAIPGGIYEDNQDAPWLYVRLIGNNTLICNKTSYYKDGKTTEFYSSLFAYPRVIGGSGAESRITVTSSVGGSLTINAVVNEPSAEIRAVSCDGPFTVTGNATVNVNFGGKGVKKDVAGVWGNTTVESNAKINITASTSPMIITGKKPAVVTSDCIVRGIMGSLTANTAGFVSVNVKTSNGNHNNYCATGPITTKNSTSIYLETNFSTGFTTAVRTIDKTNCTEYKFSDGTNKTYYQAVVSNANTSSLKPVNWTNVFSSIEYPKYGDENTFSSITEFTKNTTAGAFVKPSALKHPSGYGVGGGSSSFTEFKDSLYSFAADIVPLPGYYVVAPTASNLKYESSYPVGYGASSNSTTGYSGYYGRVYYSYHEFKINSDNVGGNFCSVANRSRNTELTLTPSTTAGVTYQWYVGEMVDGGTMYDKYEECNYPQSIYTSVSGQKLTIKGAIVEDEFYDSPNAQELEGLAILCEATQMPSGQTATTKTAYYTWGHNWPLTAQPNGSTHTRECLDANCSVSITEKHNANADGKCTRCGQTGLVYIKTQPKPATVNSNGKISFTVEATGDNVKYSWYRVTEHSNQPAGIAGFSGKNTATLTLDSAEAANKNLCEFNGDEYYCTVSNEYGSVSTMKVKLTVEHVKKSVERTTDGHSIFCCCGEEYVKNQKHTFTSTITKQPTCTAKGEKKFTCSVCGFAYTEAIAAKGHTKVTDKAVAATVSKDGKTAGAHCSVCKAVITKQNPVYKVSKISLSKTELTYNGKTQKPTVTVKDSKGNTLKNGTDYTVKYSNSKSKATGKYTVTITLKGKYSGTKKLTYTIAPKAVKDVKVTSPSKKNVKVTFSKATGATGYEIQYSTKKSSGFKKLTTVTKTSCTYKKLTSSKTYYFKVRAYTKASDGTKVYGAWSKVYSAKIK